MRIIRFAYERRVRWGILDKNVVRVLKGGPFEKTEYDGERIPYEKVTLRAPSSPSKIILAGLNYRDHAKELNMQIPKEPVIFLKPVTSLIAQGEAIVYPQSVKRLDYEGELALVIKKTGRNIPQDKVDNYILGYTCLNDVTARDMQKEDIQWTRAKSFDTFCPLGPWIETEFSPHRAKISSYLNGTRMQDSHTSNFLFSVCFLVSFISGIMTLLPGDVISTGTPQGAGEMRVHDTIEVEIEGIGKLMNYVK